MNGGVSLIRCFFSIGSVICSSRPSREVCWIADILTPCVGLEVSVASGGDGGALRVWAPSRCTCGAGARATKTRLGETVVMLLAVLGPVQLPHQFDDTLKM